MLKYRTISTCILSLILLIIAGCVEDQNDQPLYVVEAFIFSGEPVTGLRVKELTPLDSGSKAAAPIIDDAIVVLTKDDKSYQLQFDVASGSYNYPGNDLQINSGDAILLDVDVKGRKAFGETLVPEPPAGVRKDLERIVIPQLVISLALREQITELFTSARLKVEWDNDGEDFHYIVIDDLEDEIDPILPEQVPDDAKELLSSFRFITEPTTNTSFDVVGVALETYGMHTAKVYRVNEEYADLFQNDTQDSRDLNAPPSNMIGAFGIFTSFASDSVIFEVVRE